MNLPTLEAALADGRIHPGMQRKEADRLAARRYLPKPTDPWDLDKALQRIQAAVYREVAAAPKELRISVAVRYPEKVGDRRWMLSA